MGSWSEWPEKAKPLKDRFDAFQASIANGPKLLDQAIDSRNETAIRFARNMLTMASSEADKLSADIRTSPHLTDEIARMSAIAQVRDAQQKITAMTRAFDASLAMKSGGQAPKGSLSPKADLREKLMRLWLTALEYRQRCNELYEEAKRSKDADFILATCSKIFELQKLHWQVVVQIRDAAAALGLDKSEWRVNPSDSGQPTEYEPEVEKLIELHKWGRSNGPSLMRGMSEERTYDGYRSARR
jgi:hypothetical protein